MKLMPLSIYKKLSIRKFNGTRMNLKSTKHPYGIAEYVLVKIEKFSFPVDFVIVTCLKMKRYLLLLFECSALQVDAILI